MDISFYVFTYPLLRFVLGLPVHRGGPVASSPRWSCTTCSAALRLQSAGARRSARRARAHLSVLLGVFVLLKAVAYWLDRYGLVLSERGWSPARPTPTSTRCCRPRRSCRSRCICALLFFANVVRRRRAAARHRRSACSCCRPSLIGGVYPAADPAVPGQAERGRQGGASTSSATSTRPAGVRRRRREGHRLRPNTTPSPRAGQQDDRDPSRTSACSTPTVVVADVRAAAADPRLLRVPGPARHRPLHRSTATTRRTPSSRSARSTGAASPSQRNWINEPPGLHARLRRRRRARQPGRRRRARRRSSRSDIPPTGALGDHAAAHLLRRAARPPYSIVGAQAGDRRVRLPGGRERRPASDNTIRRRRAASASAALFNRTALRAEVPGEEPPALRRDQRRRRGSSTTATRASACRRPRRGSRSTATRTPRSSTAGSSGSSTATRRPTATRTPQRTSLGDATQDTSTTAASAAQPSDRGQLHPQLGEGHRRRVRRHRHALRLGRDDPVLKTWMKAFPGTVKPRRRSRRACWRTCATRRTCSRSSASCSRSTT